MTEHEPISDVPTPDEARQELDRIVTSTIFLASPQISSFLSFVVEAVLHGNSDRIKSYTIGVEVLRRGVKFNPQFDPIVRVEATRLRRALGLYYSGPGLNDPVIINLPVGHYVPTFRRRGVSMSAAVPAGEPFVPLRRLRRLVAGMAAILAVVGVGLLALFLLPRYNSNSGSQFPATTGSIGTQPSVSSLPPGNGMPTIEVEPLHVDRASQSGMILAGSLTEKLRDAFSHFDYINVISASSSGNGVVSGTSAAQSPAQSRADYRLSGSIEYDDTITDIRLQLVDTAEGTIVWSRTFKRPTNAINQSAGDDNIVATVANTLLQSYGVIRSHDLIKYRNSTVMDPRYRCSLEATDSFRSFDRAAYESVRACLEHLTTIDPGFAIGFETLAVIYNRDYTVGYDTPAGEPSELDRALRAARRAIELNPASSHAYQDLILVLYSRHDLAAAFAAGDKAMELNKYDMLTVGGYGGRLVMTGEVERGMAMLRRASENSEIRPSWQNFFMFLGSYLGGDMNAARFDAEQITTNSFPFGLVARAITENDAGNADQARKAINRLIELQPQWRDNPRRMLELQIYDPKIVTRLLRDLAAAGLPSGS